MAVSRAGEALAIWDSQTTHGLPNTDDLEIEVASSAPGHRFGPPSLLSTPDELGDSHPFAGFDRAGEAVAMWSDAQHVWYAVREPHGSFGKPRMIENPNTSPAKADVQRPVYALGADGSAVAAWYYYGAVYAAYRPAGHGFGPAEELDAATAAKQTDSAPAVAVGGDGRALVGWTANSRPYSDATERIMISASKRTAGARRPFEPARSVLTHAALGGIAMDARGDATIVGAGVALDEAAGVAVVRSSSGRVSAPESLGPTDKGPVYGVFSVAYDPAGDVFVAWRRIDSQLFQDSHGEVYVEERRANRHFTGRPISVSGSSEDPRDPLVATGAPGDASVVWPTTSRTNPFANRIAGVDSHRDV